VAQVEPLYGSREIDPERRNQLLLCIAPDLFLYLCTVWAQLVIPQADVIPAALPCVARSNLATSRTFLCNRASIVL